MRAFRHYHILRTLMFRKVYVHTKRGSSLWCGVVGWPTKAQFREIAWCINKIVADQKEKGIELLYRYRYIRYNQLYRLCMIDDL